MLHPRRYSKAIERALVDAEREASTSAPVSFMAAFDAETYWRSRGEPAIRAEMERALERRARRRRDA